VFSPFFFFLVYCFACFGEDASAIFGGGLAGGARSFSKFALDLLNSLGEGGDGETELGELAKRVALLARRGIFVSFGECDLCIGTGDEGIGTGDEASEADEGENAELIETGEPGGVCARSLG
jgi:hypothetical protein